MPARSVRSARRHLPVLFAVAALAPSIAVGAPTDGRVRLSLETSVLSYGSVTLSSGGTSLARSQTDFGLGAGGLGVGVGLGLGLGESFVLGGRALYQSSTQTGDGLGADVTTTGVVLSATPEYVFSGEALRPFVGATLGHRSVESDSGALSTSTSIGFVGPTLGLHAFAADSVSIDPSVSALYEAGSTSSAGVDLDRSGVAVLVGVSLSGWLGGAPAPVGSRPDASGASPSHDVASADARPAVTQPSAECLLA